MQGLARKFRPYGRDKTKSIQRRSDSQSVLQKEKAPRFLRGLLFTLFSLSTFGVAPASPFATARIIGFDTLEVKRPLDGFAFIPAVSEANGRVLLLFYVPQARGVRRGSQTK